MGKGGEGKGGGYPWWEHLKGGSRAGGGEKGTSGKAGGDEPAPSQKKAATGSKVPLAALQRRLQDMEGAPYPRYKDLAQNGWDVEGRSIMVFFDRVQGDAYAPPSWIRARVPMSAAGFPKDLVLGSRVRNTAVCDFLTRVLSDLLRGGGGTDWTQAVQGGGWSSSKGGDLQVDTPGQFVIERTSVVANSKFVEARVTLALPARGRSIEGYRAADIVGGLLEAVEGSLFYSALDTETLQRHVESVEDQDALRKKLPELGLIAFVGNGSVLPRKSGVDGRPMTREDSKNLVLFKSPECLEVTVRLPHAGEVLGMGIKRGITVIVGGGFHGKSTLLQALQLGIYNKVPGDGREFVVCDPAAVKIRAEDGRSVKCTDISPFINNLPFGKTTTEFSTGDASGSTSQAANIMEALEVGARVLLVDEDTCATNFMIRDDKMKALVAPDKEPITAFVQKVKPLFEELDVSTVLVVGGSGDFFGVADSVIMMDEYAVLDVTQRAKEVAAGSVPPAPRPFGNVGKRQLRRNGLAAEGKVAARNLRCIQYGETEVELSCVEQLVETSQARAIGDCLQRLATGDLLGERKTFSDVIDDLEKEITGEGKPVGDQGLDNLSRREPCPFYVLPRRFEIAAAVNRLRTAQILAHGKTQGSAKSDRSAW
jgi:predicted ABC-class ATPase